MLSSSYPHFLRVPSMKHLDQLSIGRISELARKATRDAVADTVARGLPVTARIDGKVVTLSADDPRLAEFRPAKAEDRRHETV